MWDSSLLQHPAGGSGSDTCSWYTESSVWTLGDGLGKEAYFDLPVS